VTGLPDAENVALAALLERLEDLAARLERSVDRLSGTSGPTIATDTVPRPSSIQADAAMFYTLSAGDIAVQLGLPATRVSMLLNSACLDLVHRKPELWSHDIYDKTKRRLWHPQTIVYLREVLMDPNHPDRQIGAPYCRRVIDECAAALSPRA
jgi:hypothetical protein